jgi:hypothetical protein
MPTQQRRHLVSMVKIGDSGNSVAPGDGAAPGWGLHPRVRALRLRGDYRPGRHGNWRHGVYAKADDSMMKVMFCEVLLKRGLDRWPAELPIPPELLAPVGWPMFARIRLGGVAARRG